MANTILLRRGTAAAWTSANPTLQSGEPGFETDTGKFKIGDGATAWNSLAYANSGGSVTEAQISLSDVTTDDASTSRHGFLKKLTGVSGTYMNGMGQWAALSGITEAEISFADITIGDSSTLKHGFLRKLSGVSGTYLNGLGQWAALSGITESELLFSDVTDNNATTGRHGFLKKLTGSATDYMDGSGNWSVPAGGASGVSEAGIALSDVTTDDVNNVRHGFTPKSPGDATKFLQGITNPVWAVPSGNVEIGGSMLVYRYTVTGSDKASIDTGSDTANAGSNDWTDGDVLEVLIYDRTDETTVSSQVGLFFNNDTTAANYVGQYSRFLDGAASSSFSEGTSAQGVYHQAPGASSTASVFGICEIVVPNYSGTVGYKTATADFVIADAQDGGANVPLRGTIARVWKNTSAITRIKIAPATAGKKLVVGTQILIYKRKAS